MTRRFLLTMSLVGFSLLGGVASADDNEDCGSLKNAFGPFDYRERHQLTFEIDVVETRHFTAKVESLQSGSTASDPTGDLDYTLRAWPNHHRALHSMMRYQLLNERPPNARFYSIRCYFKRAMKFSPDDYMVHLLFGVYLHKDGQYQKALQRYKEAQKGMPGSAEVNYNIGLLYMDTKDYEKAREYANRAYELGYPLPGLKIRLERIDSEKR